MSLYKAMQNLKYDARLLERNVTNGTVSQEELKKHLESLPDLSHNVETVGESLDKMEADDSADEQH